MCWGGGLRVIGKWTEVGKGWGGLRGYWKMDTSWKKGPGFPILNNHHGCVQMVMSVCGVTSEVPDTLEDTLTEEPSGCIVWPDTTSRLGYC